MSECKCGNCGLTVPDGWHCRACGFPFDVVTNEESRKMHFARRLERVEAMVRKLLPHQTSDPVQMLINTSRHIDAGSSASEALVRLAVEQIDALDAWAQAQGCAK